MASNKKRVFQLWMAVHIDEQWGKPCIYHRADAKVGQKMVQVAYTKGPPEQRPLPCFYNLPLVWERWNFTRSKATTNRLVAATALTMPELTAPPVPLVRRFIELED